jgi:predicted small lipoprotein YifL
MRVLKVIVGAALLMSMAGCAYYGPGYERPYYHHYAYRY